MKEIMVMVIAVMAIMPVAVQTREMMIVPAVAGKLKKRWTKIVLMIF